MYVREERGSEREGEREREGGSVRGARREGVKTGEGRMECARGKRGYARGERVKASE